MAQIRHSAIKKCKKVDLAEDEAPEHVNSEEESVIKELVHKQTNPQTTLAEQLNLQQNFISSPPSDLQSLTKYEPGKSSLEKFTAQFCLVKLEENLRRHGCSNEDIKMALELQQGEAFFKEKHKMLEDSILETKIASLKSKIIAVTTTQISQSEISEIPGRDKKALMKNVINQSSVSKIMQGVVQSKQKLHEPVFYPEKHPMNHLVELDKELFGHLKSNKAVQKRKRKTPGSYSPFSQTQSKKPSVSCSQIDNEHQGSLWDVKSAPKISKAALIPRAPTDIKTRIYTCAPQRYYTIENKKLHCLGKKLPKQTPVAKTKSAIGASFVVPMASQLVPLVEISDQRLSLNEIFQIPRFANYTPGVPGKTLFIKNLPYNVTETQLVSLFGHFEDPDPTVPRIVYRLMGGKMKGQAFLTFPSIKQSTNAMEHVNGYTLNGKPIIIQFGKKS